MKKISLIFMCVCLSGLFWSSIVFSKDYKFKIAVEIDTNGKQLNSKITSYIERELRSLKDVGIVNLDYEYLLKIIGFNNESNSGETIGYTIAYAILDRKDRLLRIGVRTIPLNDLGSFCEDVVVILDVNVFRERRKFLQENKSK